MKLLLGLLLFVVPVVLAQAQSDGSPPGILRLPPKEGFAGPTTWVSAAAAADANRILKWELLDDTEAGSAQLRATVHQQEPTARKGAVDVADVPERQCAERSISTSSGNRALSVADLLDNSIGIFAGSITEITPGFSIGVPVSLLTVKVQDTLRGAQTGASVQTLYVFSAVAHFRIGSYVFCGESSSAWGEPARGDRVLIFVSRWVREGTGFVSPSSDQVIFDTPKGLQIPTLLRGDSRLQVQTFDALVARVQQMVGPRPMPWPTD
jgi:hypothetical protein